MRRGKAPHVYPFTGRCVRRSNLLLTFFVFNSLPYALPMPSSLCVFTRDLARGPTQPQPRKGSFARLWWRLYIGPNESAADSDDGLARRAQSLAPTRVNRYDPIAEGCPGPSLSPRKTIRNIRRIRDGIQESCGTLWSCWR